MADKYMKKYSASLVIRELHIKTTLRFHFTTESPSSRYRIMIVNEAARKKKLLYIVGVNVTWNRTGNQDSSKNLK